MLSTVDIHPVLKKKKYAQVCYLHIPRNIFILHLCIAIVDVLL